MRDHLWKAINYLRDYSRDKEHGRRYLLARSGHHSCFSPSQYSRMLCFRTYNYTLQYRHTYLEKSFYSNARGG